MNRTLFKNDRIGLPQAINLVARTALAATLLAVFTASNAGAAVSPSPWPQEDSENTPTVRERLEALPPHTTIQVKLHDKRVRGRLSMVTRKGFVLQVTAGGKIKNEKFSYNDVRSIDAIEANGKGKQVSIHIVVDNGSGSGVDVQIDH